jgi:iron complex outermembrane receptor protein
MLFDSSFFVNRGAATLFYSAVSLLVTFSSRLPAASEIGLIPEHYFFEEIPIVLSATRLSQPLANTPAAITIIDKEMIRASGAVEIPDLLRLVPGFQVARYHGAKYTATYHGNADQFARDMQVLIDGRSVYDPVFGGVSWSDLPLAIEDINRIEVIRGPNAAAYGSNSFSGVINIITEYPSEQKGTLMKITAGSENTHQGLLRHAGALGKLDYRVTLSYDENTGFATRPDDSDTAAGSFRGDYQFDANDSISIQLGYSGGLREDGYYGDTVQPPRDTHHTYHFQQLRWNHVSSPNSESSLQFYHNYQQVDDVFQMLTLSELLIAEGVPPALVPGLIAAFGLTDLPPVLGYGFESQRYDLEFQNTSRLSDELRIVWGLGARHDSGAGKEVFNTSSTIDRDQWRAFFNAEWIPVTELTMNLGIMYEDFDGYAPLLSPRLALNFHPAADHTLRLSASRAYRIPALWEAHGDLMVYLTDGAPLGQFHKTTVDLDPEEITSFEIGYLGQFPDINMTVDIRAFREEISELIAEARDYSYPVVSPLFSGVFSSFNSGWLDIEGAEIQIQYRPATNSLIHAGYSRMHAEGQEARRINALGDIDDYRNTAKQVPEESFNFLVSHRFPYGIQASAAYYYMGRLKWGGDGADLPSYDRLDLRVAKKYKFQGASGEIALILQNVDDDHFEFSESNLSEERFYLQFGMQFQ